MLLEVEVHVSVEAPQRARSGPQRDLLLRVLPAHDLRHPVLVKFLGLGAQFGVEGAVEVEGVVDLDDGEGGDAVALLEEVEDLCGGVVSLEIGPEDVVEGEAIVALPLAEGGRGLEGPVEVAVVSGEAELGNAVHGLEDVGPRGLVALVVDGLGAVEQLLRGQRVSIHLVQRDRIGDHLGELLRPRVTRAYALTVDVVVGVFNDG